MSNWSDAWSDGTDDREQLLVTYDADTHEVLGADFHPDRLADEIVILPDNGRIEDERVGSGWYLTDDGFTQTPPEGSG